MYGATMRIEHDGQTWLSIAITRRDVSRLVAAVEGLYFMLPASREYLHDTFRWIEALDDLLPADWPSALLVIYKHPPPSKAADSTQPPKT